MNRETKRVCAVICLISFIFIVAFASIAYTKNEKQTGDTTTYVPISKEMTRVIESTTKTVVTTKPTTTVATTKPITTTNPTTTVATTKPITTTKPATTVATTVTEAVETPVYDDEVELLALVTMAEAEGESEYGKRLVIDTILNRVDSKHFPDTIYGVIYQPNQFTSMTNGRVDRCTVTDEVRQLVREEMESRTNSEVIFFRTGHYSPYGTPLFQVGSHYFNKY